MIATEIEARCKYDGRPIARVPGRRPREFCNDTCRQRYHRQHQQGKHEQTTTEQQNIAALQEKLMRLGDEKERVERRVQVQRGRIAELEAEGSRLRARVEGLLGELRDRDLKLESLARTIDQLRDTEEIFSTDTNSHPLKRFLASHPHHAVRPGCVKVLDPEYGFPPAGSRGSYTDAMRRAGMTASEQADVWDAWRDMLRDELFKSYYANRDKS